MSKINREEFRRELAEALGIDPVPPDKKLSPSGKLDLSHLKPGQVEASVSLVNFRSKVPKEPKEPKEPKDQ
jgi:hypothetical protein